MGNTLGRWVLRPQSPSPPDGNPSVTNNAIEVSLPASPPPVYNAVKNTYLGDERIQRSQQNNLPVQNFPQSFRYQHTQQILLHQQDPQILQHHRRLVGRERCSYRTFIHTAARFIGITTPSGFDHIFLLFFQGGLLPHGPDPCEKRNRRTIIRAAKLSSLDQLGFPFWIQYSYSDAAIIRRIFGAIHAQETQQITHRAYLRRKRLHKAHQLSNSKTTVLSYRLSNSKPASKADVPPSEEIFLNPATSNTTGPLRDAMDGSSGLDEVELFSSDTMDSPSDFEDSKPSASSADRLPKLQSPIIVRHPPSSNSFHDALVVSPDLEDTMPDSFDMDSSKPNLPTTYSNRNLDANFFATFEKHR